MLIIGKGHGFTYLPTVKKAIQLPTLTDNKLRLKHGNFMRHLAAATWPFLFLVSPFPFYPLLAVCKHHSMESSFFSLFLNILVTVWAMESLSCLINHLFFFFFHIQLNNSYGLQAEEFWQTLHRQ